jgi:hypothetical protein
MPPHDDFDLYEHRNKKLPLAVLLYHNFFFSAIYAVTEGRLSFGKRRTFDSDSLKSSLLLPTYWTWLVVEASRLYAGQRGVLLDKGPELTAFLLLSFFPQTLAIIYLGFLQESLSWHKLLMNVIMITTLLLEAFLTWRLLWLISVRETEKQNEAKQVISKGAREKMWIH